jgi:hypothetical protein
MPFDRPSQDLRASDADREATVERLRVAAMEGRLDADELEERLTTAYASRWCSELERLTRDVTPTPPAWRTQRPARTAPIVMARHRRMSGLAIASLIAALCVWAGPAAAIAAIVLGHIALARIWRSGGYYRGKGFALTGLTIGYIELLGMVLWRLSHVPWWH